MTCKINSLNQEASLEDENVLSRKHKPLPKIVKKEEEQNVIIHIDMHNKSATIQFGVSSENVGRFSSGPADVQ